MTEPKVPTTDGAQFMLGRISADVESLVRGMDEVKDALRDIPKVYATKDEVEIKIEPLKKWYYLLIGIGATGLIGGAIALLFRLGQGGP